MVFGELIGGIAGPIFEEVWKLGGSAIKDVKQTYRKVDAFNRLYEACRRYEQRYRNRHGQIHLMPGLRKDPLPLESVYTTVKLLSNRSIKYFQTEQGLEEAFRQSDYRSFQLCNEERLDGIDFANHKKFLMVLGGPGIGKSTFLRKLGMEAFKSEGLLHQRCMPIFIELKELKEKKINLLEIIANEIEICGFPAAYTFAETALNKGQFLILLDGLDEVPRQNLINVAKCIEDFVDHYDQNRFVVSCRIAAYESSFRRFTDVTISEFDDEQINQFINNWFSSDLDRQFNAAGQYWEILSAPENKAVKELAHTPLLLTFLCLVYDRKQNLPKNRSSLFGKAIDILLEDWAAQKRLEKDQIYEGFYPELEKELLAEIAYDNFKEEQYFFHKSIVSKKISIFLADTLGAPERLDGDSILKAIEVQQGVLVERARDIYSFSHLTIQEFLSAQFIVDNDLIEEIVCRYTLKDRWREVILLMSGLLRGQVQKLWLNLEKVLINLVQENVSLKNILRSIDADNNYMREGFSYRISALLFAADIITERAVARYHILRKCLRAAIVIADAYPTLSASFGERELAVHDVFKHAVEELIEEAVNDAINEDVEQAYRSIFKTIAVAKKHEIFY